MDDRYRQGYLRCTLWTLARELGDVCLKEYEPGRIAWELLWPGRVFTVNDQTKVSPDSIPRLCNVQYPERTLRVLDSLNRQEVD